MKNFTILVGVSAMAAVVSLWAPDVGASVTSLVRDVNLDRAYFTGVRPALVYAGLPLVVIGALILIMAPGLLAALLVTRVRSIWDWLIDGFALTTLIVSGAAALTQSLTGRAVTGATFVGILAGLTAVLAVAVRARASLERGIPWAPPHPGARFAIGSLLAVPAAFLIVLVPKFFWESFNGDGVHMYEAARLLLFQPLPFFSADAGPISGWPGVNGLIVPYQASWFLRLFGPVEASVRLPLLLDMSLLVAAIAAVAEAARATRLNRSALVLIWGSVISFALAMSFAATYNPYSADVSMPAPMDTLVMVSCLAAVSAFAERAWWRLAAWTAFSLLVSPAGLLVLGASMAALWVVNGIGGWRRALPYGLGLAGVLAGVSVLGTVLSQLGILQGGGEHGGLRLILRQFGSIALLDIERFGWALIPTGLYPVAGLFAWRASDEVGRILIVTTGLLFAFFYPMGELSLHYFVPVMVLPVAVYWRQWPGASASSPLALAGCAIAVTAAIVLASPRGTAVYDGTRNVGERIDVTAFSRYHANDPAALRATAALSAILPDDSDAGVPDRRYGDSPLAWNYYAQHRPASSPSTYVLARPDQELPSGATLAGRSGDGVAGVYDQAAWMRDRALAPRRSQARSILTVPRHVLFFDPAASPRPGFIQPHTWPWLRRLAGLPPLDHGSR